MSLISPGRSIVSVAIIGFVLSWGARLGAFPEGFFLACEIYHKLLFDANSGALRRRQTATRRPPAGCDERARVWLRAFLRGVQLPRRGSGSCPAQNDR